MSSRAPRYRLADTAQQIVGGFLLAGPFVVTEEVWTLAGNMRWWHTLLTVGIVFAIGYGALYEADDDRDPDREPEVAASRCGTSRWCSSPTRRGSSSRCRSTPRGVPRRRGRTAGGRGDDAERRQRRRGVQRHRGGDGGLAVPRRRDGTRSGRSSTSGVRLPNGFSVGVAFAPSRGVKCGAGQP